MSKLLLLAAGATGYVLGARAGRERYDQISSQAQRLWSNPNVQSAAQDAQHLAREKAPVVGEKLGDAAKKTASAVQSKVSRSDDSETSQPSPTTGTTPITGTTPTPGTTPMPGTTPTTGNTPTTGTTPTTETTPTTASGLSDTASIQPDTDSTTTSSPGTY